AAAVSPRQRPKAIDRGALVNRILFVVLFAASSISHALVQLEIPGAYKYFAAKHQIPADVLFAVCLQESGKRWQDKHLPWPWTLNIAGKGAYYDTPADAHRQLLQVINGGSCRDRKSTRLNSSHVKISYAVFCLKKKKKRKIKE